VVNLGTLKLAKPVFPKKLNQKSGLLRVAKTLFPLSRFIFQWPPKLFIPEGTSFSFAQSKLATGYF
jgi:hypothetical protein